MLFCLILKKVYKYATLKVTNLKLKIKMFMTKHTWSKISILSFFLFFCFCISLSWAQTCPINTVGLSKSNYSGKQGEVLALQMMLAVNPDIYPEGIMSGTFGNATEKAVKKIQSDNGLNLTGILDQDTIDTVCDYYNTCPWQTLLLSKDSEETYEIKALQSILTFLGYYSSGVTGTFGPKTEAGLIKYQKAKDLYPTGLVDYDTQTQLCDSFSILNTVKPKLTTPSTTKSTNTLKVSCYASPNPVKINQNVTFYASVSGGTGVYTYEWYGSGSGDKKSFNRSFTSAGNYDINLRITDSLKQVKTAKCSVSVYEPAKTGISAILPSFLFRDTNPSVKLTSNVYTINQGDSINLTWSSKNVSNCFVLSSPGISGFTGSISISGSKTISNIQQTTLFSIMCTKDDSSTFDYLTIMVGGGVPSSSPINIGPIDSSPTTSSSSTTTTTTREDTMKKNFEKYVKNPVNLSCNTWPKEIVIGDPVKFEISGFPADFGYTRKEYVYNENNSDQVLVDKFYNYLTKGGDSRFDIFWTGDLISSVVAYLNSLKNHACAGDSTCNQLRESLIKSAGSQSISRSSLGMIQWNQLLRPNWVNKLSSAIEPQMTRSEVSIAQKAPMADYDRLFWVFNTAGSYNISYQAQFDKSIIARANCSITVLNKPTVNNYLEVFVSSEAYSGTNFSSADNNCSNLASKATFKGVWKAYTNDVRGKLVPSKTTPGGLSAENLPYRDLAGRLIAYNYDYLVKKESKDGGGIWYPIQITESIKQKEGLYKPDVELLYTWAQQVDCFENLEYPGSFSQWDPRDQWSKEIGSLSNLQSFVKKKEAQIDEQQKYYWAFQGGRCTVSCYNNQIKDTFCPEDPFKRVWFNVWNGTVSSNRGTECKVGTCLDQHNAGNILTCNQGCVDQYLGCVGDINVMAYPPNVSSKMRVYCFQKTIQP